MKQLHGGNFAISKMDFNKDVFSVLKGRGSELDWCAFENRVKELVLELVEPLNDFTKDNLI